MKKEFAMSRKVDAERVNEVMPNPSAGRKRKLEPGFAENSDRVVTFIPNEMKDEIKVYCIKHKTNLSEFLLRAITEYYEKTVKQQ